MAAPVAFPNYLELPTGLPIGAWKVLRVFSVLTALGLAALLYFKPALGLPLFWQVIVPLLPLVFLLAPGVWRNICPMAAMNQAPRLLGFTRGREQTATMREYSYVVGIALFLILVSSRKWLLDQSGSATSLLILSGLGGALLGGLAFKGKSGWCSSICPMLPVQRLYGQTPFKAVGNAHCRPCVGCTKNCYDFNPRAAYLSDQYDADPHYVAYRKLFAALLPGFILAWFTVPTGSPPAAVYVLIGLYCALSLALFQVLDTFLKVHNNRLPIAFGGAAFCCYYWFAADTWLHTAGRLAGWDTPVAAVWGARAALGVLALAWMARGFATENAFREQMAQRSAGQPVRLGAGAVAALRAAEREADVELVIAPEQKRVPAQAGQTLLELIEGCGGRIEAGCRMGVCGADPVAVCSGAQHLSPIGHDEQNTLARLGFAPNTRMACSARLQSGSATITLQPEKAQAPLVPAVASFDRSIREVVIIGNGIAGVTAADHLRRRHPECSIRLVAEENHHLYNRMGITRLVYGRSAMQGLHLMPDGWYAERNIDVLLNTTARGIDRETRAVELADGGTLPYDRLVLATGSSSFVPPMAQWGADGCFVLRSANDAMQMRHYAQHTNARTAVVAGGGLLGLEAAYALHKLGLHVSVVERNAWLLHRQLDRQGGQVLQRYLRSVGLDILVDTRLDSLTRDESQRRMVRLSGDNAVPADIFVVAAGIVPNTALAKAAGLETRRGVIVDAGMRTSDPAIFAAGDVAEFEGRIPGLWPVAVEQAEVAACNALGESRAYREPVLSTMLKVVGADLVSVGQYDAAEGDEALVEEDINEHRYRKLVLRNGVLRGAILIGWPDLVEPVCNCVKAARDASPVLDSVRASDWTALTAL
jgi:NADPH-dependent 2,4-dienoyl-CoA reductase/sulfur reductase-like enzyme/ferredoxin